MLGEQQNVAVDPNYSDGHDQHWIWTNIYRRQPKRICHAVNTLPLDTPIHANSVRFVCISDTHGKMDAIMPKIPDGDILLHCGDFTEWGDRDELEKFNAELGQLPHPVKIVVPGNHEFGMEKDVDHVTRMRLDNKLWEKAGCRPRGTSNGQILLTNCTYFLHDSGVQVNGIKIYGTGWNAAGIGHAFYRKRGRHLLDEWLKIPPVDVLITHMPPLGHLDVNASKQHRGCAELLNCVERRIKPKFHVFGHIHGQNGACTNSMTTFVNASICIRTEHGGERDPACLPVIFDFPFANCHAKKT